MKASELRPLVGHSVWVNWNGERSGVIVGVVGTDKVRVQLRAPHGTRKISLEDVIHVRFFGRQLTVSEFFKMLEEK